LGAKFKYDLDGGFKVDQSFLDFLQEDDFWKQIDTCVFENTPEKIPQLLRRAVYNYVDFYKEGSEESSKHIDVLEGLANQGGLHQYLNRMGLYNASIGLLIKFYPELGQRIHEEFPTFYNSAMFQFLAGTSLLTTGLIMLGVNHLNRKELELQRRDTVVSETYFVLRVIDFYPALTGMFTVESLLDGVINPQIIEQTMARHRLQLEPEL
jgi:hypothetical protein